MRRRKKRAPSAQNADTLDKREWLAEVATSYRLLDEIQQATFVVEPPSFYAMAAMMVERMKPGIDRDELRLMALGRLSLSLRRAARRAGGIVS